MQSRPRTTSGPATKGKSAEPRSGDGASRRLGQYELLVRLAAGGAANVFLVRDTRAQQLVALKVLLPSLASNDDFLNMFFTEARIAARLQHPNAVAITGFGQNDGIHCLAMEYVFGASLSQVLKQSARVKKPLTVGVLLRVTATVCDALHVAHELRGEDGKPMGLVHRDVTPQNILIGFNGVPKLTDFGIAKATGRGWETQAGIVKGKFSYMSPEQALGKKIDRRSDIFCTGIVLWEALTGKELFKGTSPMEVIEAIREQPIEPPSKVVPGLSPIVDPIVMKALKRAPRQRYQTAAEMRQEIEDLIARAGVSIDSQTISRELSDIFGQTIVDRAMALRAAMAGRADLEELAKVLGGQRLRDDHLPVIPGGASHPDPLGLFSEQPDLEDFAIDEAAVEAPMPARAEQEFTRAFSAIKFDVKEFVSEDEPPAPPEPSQDLELQGFDVDEDGGDDDGAEVSAVDGWEDHTRVRAPSDELLAVLAEGDRTIGMLPSQLTTELAFGKGSRSSDEDDIDRTISGDGVIFDEEYTIDASRPGLLHEPQLPRAPAAAVRAVVVPPSARFTGAPSRSLPPPTAPSQRPSAPAAVAHAETLQGPSVVLRGVSAKNIASAETIPQSALRSSRPVPRAPSLDMAEIATPRPELELLEEPILPLTPSSPPPPSPLPSPVHALPSVSPRRTSALTPPSLASALEDVSSESVGASSAGSLPRVDPSPLDDPEDELLRSAVASMPGTPAMRAPSAVHKPAISSLSSGDASVSPGEAIRALGSPDLSIGSLRELAGVEQRTALAPSVSGGWASGEAPALAARHITPEPQRPSSDPDAVRIRPVGLILLGVMFIALGVVLGVVVVRFFFSPAPTPMPPVSPPPVSAPPSAS
jgi:serine/threonine protein kinase